jgi:hypothetical protein
MAAGLTYFPIANYLVTTPVASYTFSSIPQNYTDLVLVTQSRVSIAGGYTGIQFNGDALATGTNYSQTNVQGNGNSLSTGIASNHNASGANQGVFPGFYFNDGNATWDSSTYNIMSYSNTTTWKTVLVQSGNPYTNSQASAATWKNTAAINSITITTAISGTNTFAAGSTFSLYGLAAA